MCKSCGCGKPSRKHKKAPAKKSMKSKTMYLKKGAPKSGRK